MFHYLLVVSDLKASNHRQVAIASELTSWPNCLQLDVRFNCPCIAVYSSELFDYFISATSSAFTKTMDHNSIHEFHGARLA